MPAAAAAGRGLAPAGMLVGAPFSEQLLVLEEGALGGVEFAQERHDVGGCDRRGPLDPFADLVAHLGHEPHCIGRDRAPQQLLQHLQLERAIGPQLRVREDELGLSLDQIAEEDALRQRYDERPGQHVTAAHAIAVDERQRRKQEHPQRDPEVGPVHPAARRLARSQQDAEWDEGLDLAREVARHDRRRLQRAAGPVDHPQADHALARRRAPPGELERHKIQIADHERDEQRDRNGDEAAAAHADGGNDRDHDHQHQHEPDEQIQRKGNEPFAVVGKLDGQRDALGRHDLPALAPGAFQKIGRAIMRERHRRCPLPASVK